ncbi:retrotransposable element Tf2 [Tanacetum coccineum]
MKWLPMAEFWYNTNFHSAINTTPYEAVYYQTPPIYIPYIPGDSIVESMDITLQSREEAIYMLKFHMKRAHDRMQNQVDKHRADTEFEVFAKPQSDTSSLLHFLAKKVSWKRPSDGKPFEEATWEIYVDVLARFPDFDAACGQAHS